MTHEEILKRNLAQEILKRNADGDKDDPLSGEDDSTQSEANQVTSPKPVEEVKAKVISTTDKLGVSQNGNISGFLWGILIGAVIVWQWANIVKLTKMFGKN